MSGSPFSPLLDRALRRAADAHRHQTRKGTTHPYVQHPAAVAMILARLGFDDAVLAAAVLHDVVEDADVPLAAIRAEFGEAVADLVDWLTERKHDAAGAMRSWAERKAEQLGRLAEAPRDARAIALADKLHNLTSIAVDLEDGSPVWERFNAGRDESLRHHAAVIERLSAGDDDPAIATLAAACRGVLDQVGG